MARDYEAERKWGPLPYAQLGGTVAKFRRSAAARGGLAAMPPGERHAYGEAVLTAVRAIHRRLHMKPAPPPTPPRLDLTPISRLSHYELPMVGDPNWSAKSNSWAARERAVYKHAMGLK